MHWLRPILLLAGALFLLGIFWRERRRGRQAAEAGAERTERSARTEPSFEAAVASTGGDREQRRALPIIEWPAGAGLPAKAAAAAEAAEAAATVGMAGAEAGNDGGADGVIGGASERAQPVLPEPGDPAPMIIDWPDEHSRRIVTLRIVPAGTDRLPGRAVRQGLSACGFRPGQFGIYHLPGEDGRVVLSAASLVRPGTLDPAAMDFQRYAGLNLFAVLPGPLSAERTLERLGQVAIEVAGRVAGRVQDDVGTMLGAAGAGEWRRRMLATLGPAPVTGAAAAASVPAGPAD